jgi:predicted alpha-1,6-mannanase (GH76 family)
VWCLPGTLLGVSGWPASLSQRIYGPWNYWWQAHVLDCLVDAYIRSPDDRRRTAIERFANGIRVRIARNWLNDYFDDMAWLALALQRAEQYAGLRRPGAVSSLADRLRAGWTDEGGGGVWWRKPERYHDDFKNVPTNGPAAILFARLSDGRADAAGGPGDRQQALDTMNWIEEYLVDDVTGLVYDGLHVGADGGVAVTEKTIYTYCQGVFIGACIELACRDDAEVWALRAVRTIDAVASGVTEPGLALRGQGGGDGGLFAAILARYLVLAATKLPTLGSQYAAAGQLAADLVYNSADAAWRNRTVAPGGPLFGPDWTKPALAPGRGGEAERDLSVQAGAWMLLEAAATLERAGINPTR